MASTPASARSPRSASSPTRSTRCSQPAAQPRGRRRRAAAGARRARDDGAARQRARAAVTPGIRLATLDALLALLNRGVHPRRAAPRLGRRQRRPRAARASRAGADRRRRGADAASVACTGARGAAARGPARRSRSARKKGSRSSTARRRPRRCWRWPWSTPSGWRAPPTSPPRCRSTPCAGRPCRSMRASTPRGRIAGQARVGRQHRPADGRQRHQRVACRLRTRAGRLLGALRRRRCTAPHAMRSRYAHADGRSRSQRVDRQPDGLRRQPATSSRAATSTARRSPSPPICTAIALAHAGDDQRAADRTARQSRAERAARVPDRARRAGVGADAGAGDRGGADVGDEVARASRLVDTIPTSANKEDHVSMSMGAALKAADVRRARHARGRGRAAVRGAGDRSARAAHDVAGAAGRARAAARVRAASRSTTIRRRADIEAIAETDCGRRV